jgi:hypothetical protein
MELDRPKNNSIGLFEIWLWRGGIARLGIYKYTAMNFHFLTAFAALIVVPFP